MIPTVDAEILPSEISLKQIDAPLPEAPWQTRCKRQTHYKTLVEDATTSQFFTEQNLMESTENKAG